MNRQLPHLGSAGRGECEARREHLVGYFREIANRLRNVRVCCGDWSRVCGESVTVMHGITGVFLDPPYADTAKRTDDLYAVDCQSVAHDVREWAIANGDNPLLRIVLAGYEGEHAMPPTWRAHAWSAGNSYGSSKATPGNRHKERLWFSPHCLPLDGERGLLF